MHQSSGGAVEARGVFLNTADSFPAKLDSGRARYDTREPHPECVAR